MAWDEYGAGGWGEEYSAGPSGYEGYQDQPYSPAYSDPGPSGYEGYQDQPYSPAYEPAPYYSPPAPSYQPSYQPAYSAGGDYYPSYDAGPSGYEGYQDQPYAPYEDPGLSWVSYEQGEPQWTSAAEASAWDEYGGGGWSQQYGADPGDYAEYLTDREAYTPDEGPAGGYGPEYGPYFDRDFNYGAGDEQTWQSHLGRARDYLGQALGPEQRGGLGAAEGLMGRFGAGMHAVGEGMEAVGQAGRELTRYPEGAYLAYGRRPTRSADEALPWEENTGDFAGVAQADPVYQQILAAQGPRAALEYAAQRYPELARPTMIGSELGNPANYIGALGPTARGLGIGGRLAEGAEALDVGVNAVAGAPFRALGAVGSRLPLTRMSRASRYGERGAQYEDVAADVLRTPGAGEDVERLALTGRAELPYEGPAYDATGEALRGPVPGGADLAADMAEQLKPNMTSEHLSEAVSREVGNLRQQWLQEARAMVATGEIDGAAAMRAVAEHETEIARPFAIEMEEATRASWEIPGQKDPGVVRSAMETITRITGEPVTTRDEAFRAVADAKRQGWDAVTETFRERLRSAGGRGERPPSLLPEASEAVQAARNGHAAPAEVEQAVSEVVAPVLEEVKREVGWRGLQPQTQRAIEEAFTSPAVKDAYVEALDHKHQLTAAAEQVSKGSERATGDLLERYGVSDPEKIDPLAVALQRHLEEWSEANLGGWKPKQGSAFARGASQVYNDWRSGVLMSAGFHLRNTADIVGKSVLEGVFPFVGAAESRLARYGFEGVTARAERTMGGWKREVEHELGAEDLMRKLGLSGAADELLSVLKHPFQGIENAPFAWMREELPSTGRVNVKIPGQLVERTWGTLKMLNHAIAGIIESNARVAAFVQGIERQMVREMSTLRAQSIRLLTEAQVPEARAIAGDLAKLEQWTPQSIKDHLLSHGVQEVLADQLAARAAAALERGQAAGVKQVERIHFNYGNRSQLEDWGFVKYIVPFTTWASNNLRYYGEVTLSRPGLYQLLQQYDKLAQNQADESNLPGRFRRSIELPKNAMTSMLAQAIYGRSDEHLYINPAELFVSIRQQQHGGFVGEGASDLGKAIGKLTELSGMSLGPLINLPLQIFGAMGNVPVNAPFGIRHAPGAAIQSVYGTLTGGRSATNDFSAAARNLPGGLNQRFGSTTGAGPLLDRQVRERLMENAKRAGESANSPRILRALNNPDSPLFQQALREVTAEQNNAGGQQIAGALSLRNVSDTQAQSRQAAAAFQREYDQLRGQRFEDQPPEVKQQFLNQYGPEAAARMWTDQNSRNAFRTALQNNPGAEAFWSQNADPAYLEQKARAGSMALFTPKDEEAAANRPAYPGQNASAEELADYYTKLRAWQQGQAGGMKESLDKYEFNQAEIAKHQDLIRQRFIDLVNMGKGPDSPEWQQAKDWNKESRDYITALHRDQSDAYGRRPEGPESPWQAQLQATMELRSAFDKLAAEQGWDEATKRRMYATMPEMATVRDFDSQNRHPIENLQADLARTWYEGLTPAQRGQLYRDHPELQNVFLAGKTDQRTGQLIGPASPAQILAAAQLLKVPIPEGAGPTLPGAPGTTPGSTPGPATAGGAAATAGGGTATGGAARRPFVPYARSTSTRRPFTPYARRPFTPYARSSGGATRGGYPQRGAAEPFSGTSPTQQWGSTWAHIQELRRGGEEGRAEASKFIYDNYDRMRGLADTLGKPLLDRGVYGQQALAMQGDRPGAYSGMTLTEGNRRFGAMRDDLREAIAAGDFDRNTFAERWSQRYGEDLSPEDLTPQALSDKLSWVEAQMAQAKRYTDTHPEGLAERMGMEGTYRTIGDLREALNAAADHRDQLKTDLANRLDSIRELQEDIRRFSSAASSVPYSQRAEYWKLNQESLDQLRQQLREAREAYTAGQHDYRQAGTDYGRMLDAYQEWSGALREGSYRNRRRRPGTSYDRYAPAPVESPREEPSFEAEPSYNEPAWMPEQPDEEEALAY